MAISARQLATQHWRTLQPLFMIPMVFFLFPTTDPHKQNLMLFARCQLIGKDQ